NRDLVYFRLWLPAGDVNLPGGVDVHVHLAAHAELRQVNAGFDTEAGSADDAPVVARFEAVDVRAVAVHLLADVVPGAVREVLAVARVLDHGARRVVD